MLARLTDFQVLMLYLRPARDRSADRPPPAAAEPSAPPSRGAFVAALVGEGRSAAEAHAMYDRFTLEMRHGSGE